MWVLTTTDSTVNVRSESRTSTSANIVTSVAHGERVTIIGETIGGELF